MINLNSILEKFKQDLKDAQEYKNTEVNPYIKNSIDRYEGKLYGNEKKGRSKFVSRDIFRQVEQQHSIIKEPFVNNTKIVKLSSLHVKRKGFVLQSMKLANYKFTRKFPRYTFMTDLIKTLQIEGTAVIRTGWDYKSKDISKELPIVHTTSTGHQINFGSMTVKDTVNIVNEPTAIVCRNEDIYIDPRATKQEDIQFIIHRTETSLSELKQQGIYKNLDQIESKVNTEMLQEYQDDHDTSFDWIREDEEAKKLFNFKDSARRKLTMYEYWGNYDLNGDGIAEPIVCTWINDTIIRLENNPFPDEKIPFIVLQFTKKPFSIYGLSMPDILDDLQKIKTGIIRGIIDDLAQSNSQQRGVRKGNLDAVNKKRFMEGKSFEYNISPNEFYQGHYTPINNQIFTIMHEVDNEINTLSNTLPGSGAGSQALGTTAASESNKLNAPAVRELDLVRNIAENAIKPLLIKWLSYMYYFMEPEEIEEITGIPFEPSNDYLEDLYSDFEINISTNQANDSKVKKLSFLLQTMGPNMPMEMSKIAMAEIAELSGMPELAIKLAQFQPKPDPLEEEMKKLEIEKAKAEIAFKQAGAKENEADYALKQAKAQEAQSKADLLDLDFTRKQENTDHENQMQIEKLKSVTDVMKHQANLELKANEITSRNKLELNKTLLDLLTKKELANIQAKKPKN